MNLVNSFEEAAASLLGAKQRSFLALIGIAVGIGAVIAMVSIGSIAQKEALRQFVEIGTDIVVVTRRDASGAKADASRGMTLENVAAMQRGCPSIKMAAAYFSGYKDFKFQGHKSNYLAYGVTPGFWQINKLKLQSGRFIHSLDGSMYHCVIGSEIADQLRKRGVTQLLGEQIIFGGRYIDIVGVLKHVPMGPMRPFEINQSVYLHAAVFQRLFNHKALSTFMAIIAPGADYIQATNQIKAYYRHLNKLDVNVRSAEELIGQMTKQMRIYTLLLGMIGSIALIVGGIGVMNVMLVSVTERTREIGIRRALGARRRDIQRQFLIESVLLCAAGGIIGIGLGVAVAYIFAGYEHWQFSVSYPAMLLGSGVSGFVGIFFGIHPARRAARMNPIMALRSN